MPMTSDAKKELSKTIRALRERLLEDLHAATDSAYRLSVRTRDAGLSEAARARRARLEAWVDEQLRAQPAKKKGPRTREDFRRDAEKQAAYTLLNRLVFLRLMEAAELRKPAVVTGGWESRGYADFRALAPALARRSDGGASYPLVGDGVGVDETEGYGFLLRLVFEDLATELPGLFGPAGVADLIPVPPATLRHVVEALDDEALTTCWSDDMTLGWVYQYWNDPEREALDAKLNSGGKVEPHEIASKTQMFTERYMVDWLLQNSLGPMWLAMCRKHGWTPECEADGTLAALEERRTDWRAKREAGEVELTDLMPLHTDMERRWAYYVPQPIPEDAVEQAPQTVRDLKLLDPAVGSGHFLVVAFDLLAALYREEARHRGVGESREERRKGGVLSSPSSSSSPPRLPAERADADSREERMKGEILSPSSFPPLLPAEKQRWSDAAIVERILEHNLHGIDLDPRAVQIAAAALWLKAQRTCREAAPRTVNLVASNLSLGALPNDDPALVELRNEVERETGIPGALTNQVIDALRGADHLGSLLKVDAAVDDAIRSHETELAASVPAQGDLYEGFGEPQLRLLEAGEARAGIVTRLEAFLARHGGQDDLGLRLRGEQLARGIRFLRMVEAGRYDLVVGNPPYQGTSKLAEQAYVKKQYALGKADLYAAFLLRGLELVRKGGVSALLTMRNWMFIKQYADLREHLLETYDLRALGDFAVGAFDEVPNDLLSVVVSAFRATGPVTTGSVAQQPTPPDDLSYDRQRTKRKRAATLCHVGRHEFDPAALEVVPEWPLVYWWDATTLERYHQYPLLGDVLDIATAQSTGDNTRFRRSRWEVEIVGSAPSHRWHPYVGGADGASWFEPQRDVVNWELLGLEIKLRKSLQQGRDAFVLASEDCFHRVGITFPKIGHKFSARLYRTPSIFGDAAPTVFSSEPWSDLCLLNSGFAKRTLVSLNPTINFGLEDVARLPRVVADQANTVEERLLTEFSAHEAGREPSPEFRQPQPSAWDWATRWADGVLAEPVGCSSEEHRQSKDEAPTSHISFALGVALGRFGSRGEGWQLAAADVNAGSSSAALLFLDATLDPRDHRDSLGHPKAQIIHDKWSEYGPAIAPDTDVRTYLRLSFFDDVHRPMYENRPIHWPLSSAKKTFVAWINIHRWNADTLRVLLAEHLHPAQTRLDGSLEDLRAARDGTDKKAARKAEKQLAKLQKQREELADFVALVTQCADQGPPPAGAKCPEREVDARYDPDLDDGVMINSAALWPLLDPQWKKPKQWWKELATAKDRKDYDWSHLAMRYWPTRVDAKCQDDPSLGVAHGCFWRYHPERAWAWELRLQDEIGPDFRIEEAPYDPPGLAGGPTGDPGHEAHRAAYLRDHPEDALAAVEKEARRRMGRGKDAKVVPEMWLLEPGLWTARPEQCWALESTMIEKQEADFRLLAPDEAEARATLLAERPELAEERQTLLAKVAPAQLDLGGEA
jgi:hypothetical protein